MGYAYFTIDQRRSIEQMYNAGTNVTEIAAKIGKSPAAVYAELQRGFMGERSEYGRRIYSAKHGQIVFEKNIANRGKRNTYED